MANKMPPRMTKSELDEKGREKVDGVPLAPPIGYRKEVSQTERIRNMIRSEHLRMAAELAGKETFEEADDFDVGDDLDPSSPYEVIFDPVDIEARKRLRDDEWRALVESRIGEMKPPKEVDDGSDFIEQRGQGSVKAGGIDANRKPEPVERKDKKTGVQSGVRKGSEGASEAD